MALSPHTSLITPDGNCAFTYLNVFSGPKIEFDAVEKRDDVSIARMIDFRRRQIKADADWPVLFVQNGEGIDAKASVDGGSDEDGRRSRT